MTARVLLPFSIMEQVLPTLPILPIRNAVLFPGVSMPLVVGRSRSTQAVEQAQMTDSLVIIVAQKTLTSGDPDPSDLYAVGCLCKIENVAVTENGSRQIIVTGIARYKLHDCKLHPNHYLVAQGEALADIYGPDTIRNEALFYNLKELAREVIELLPGATEPLIKLIDRVDDPAYLTNVCAAYLNLPLTQKQELLEAIQVESRLETLLSAMRKEREILSIQKEIREKMSERLNKAQRDALLREQLRTIRTELGEEFSEAGADELETKLKEAHLPEEAEKQASEELKRLKNLPAASAEYHVIRSYIEWLIALPWNTKTHSPIDLAKARKVLDEDHYGLEQVKKRILQFLAVAKLKNDIHGPILCLLGPPGTGKTSLGHSIARALGRKFIRTSLGGVRDEAEIRGHRRTYVGAMPGRIIQSIKRAGTKNPLMMLDEIDKLRADFHGDPSAAMLEVLDPEQNKSFTDHYIDLPFDLSEVFFVTTANVIDPIPAPLRDRMEVIEVNSYTSEEKLQIAKKYLVPKQRTENGLTEAQVHLSDEALATIISKYTREAGVRDLQRNIAAVFRATAQIIVDQQAPEPSSAESIPPPIEITETQLKEILGPEKFFPEIAERILKPGISTGLAWTPHGGDILFIESTGIPNGKGILLLTGQLGDVMKESAQIALSLARTLLPGLGKTKFDFSNHDIHIHVPAGAIAKDGPSAGTAMFASLASLILGETLHSEIGMTGEITLRGAVLAVGGIKEKIIAAHRAGLKRIFLPLRNKQDLAEVPNEVKASLNFTYIETVDQLLTDLFKIIPEYRSLTPTQFPSVA